MESLTSLFQETAFVGLSVLIQVIIVILGALLISLISKLGKKAGLDSSNAIMKEIINLVNNVVVATNQKVVDKLKEESPTGSLTEEQQKTVFESVKSAIIDCLTDEQIAYLINNYISVENGLTYFIESAVKYNHSNSGILVSEPIISGIDFEDDEKKDTETEEIETSEGDDAKEDASNDGSPLIE